MAKRLEPAPSPRALDQGVAAVYLPLGELRPNPRNPRAHGAEVVRLARTILRTTWGAPIIAQASTRRIIGGHGRLEAARMIAEGVEVDGILRGGAEHYFDRSAPGPLMVPVRLVDVSDAEADAMTPRERKALRAELRARVERESLRLVAVSREASGEAVRRQLKEVLRAGRALSRYLSAAKRRRQVKP